MSTSETIKWTWSDLCRISKESDFFSQYDDEPLVNPGHYKTVKYKSPITGDNYNVKVVCIHNDFGYISERFMTTRYTFAIVGIKDNYTAPKTWEEECKITEDIYNGLPDDLKRAIIVTYCGATSKKSAIHFATTAASIEAINKFAAKSHDPIWGIERYGDDLCGYLDDGRDVMVTSDSCLGIIPTFSINAPRSLKDIPSEIVYDPDNTYEYTKIHDAYKKTAIMVKVKTPVPGRVFACNDFAIDINEDGYFAIPEAYEINKYIGNCKACIFDDFKVTKGEYIFDILTAGLDTDVVVYGPHQVHHEDSYRYASGIAAKTICICSTPNSSAVYVGNTDYYAIDHIARYPHGDSIKTEYDFKYGDMIFDISDYYGGIFEQRMFIPKDKLTNAKYSFTYTFENGVIDELDMLDILKRDPRVIEQNTYGKLGTHVRLVYRDGNVLYFARINEDSELYDYIGELCYVFEDSEIIGKKYDVSNFLEFTNYNCKDGIVNGLTTEIMECPKLEIIHDYSLLIAEDLQKCGFAINYASMNKIITAKMIQQIITMHVFQKDDGSIWSDNFTEFPTTEKKLLDYDTEFTLRVHIPYGDFEASYQILEMVPNDLLVDGYDDRSLSYISRQPVTAFGYCNYTNAIYHLKDICDACRIDNVEAYLVSVGEIQDMMVEDRIKMVNDVPVEYMITDGAKPYKVTTTGEIVACSADDELYFPVTVVIKPESGICEETE